MESTDRMDEIDLKEIFDYFKKRYKKLIAIIILVTAVISVLNITFKTPLYSSDATLLIADTSKGKDQLNTQAISLNEKLVGTYSEIIKSRSVLEKVINNLDLKDSVGSLGKNIKVQNVPKTELIKISVINEDPGKAEEIAKEVTSVFSKKIEELYKIENIKVIDEPKKGASPFNINYLKDIIKILLAVTAMSAFIVVIMYYFDTTIKSSEVVEDKFDLIVLGLIPEGEVTNGKKRTIG